MKTLKSIVLRMTVKDFIIVVLFLLVSYMSTFIYQSEYLLDKLNAENERLQLENERYSHLLGLTTDALEKQLQKNTNTQLRDPFRPDHPTREELRNQTEP